MKAIISDIHANIEALEVVLNDIKQRGISEVICLGDVVGYGPNPAECLDLVQGFKVVLMGNHDEAVLGDAVGFKELAREAIDWTRGVLKPHGWFGSKDKKNRWDFIKNLPLTHTEDDRLYVHGSPRDPTSEYILRSDTDGFFNATLKLDEIFKAMPAVCFVGHSHVPGIIIKIKDASSLSSNGSDDDKEGELDKTVIVSKKYKFLLPSDLNYSYSLKQDQSFIVNVGSVGQPRDGDNRACYVTVNDETINYHRLEYDYNSTKEKIFKISQLDRHFGERLVNGK